MKTANLNIENDTIELPIHTGTENEKAMDISSLRSKTGYITSIDTRSVGLTVVELGGGRKKVTDSIDHSVGLGIHVALGENVKAGQPLAEIHARTEEQLNAAIQTIQNAYFFSESPPDPAVSIIDRINYK